MPTIERASAIARACLGQRWSMPRPSSSMLEHSSRRSSIPRPCSSISFPSLEHASASDGACLGHPLSCSSIPPVARAFLGHARACSSISLPSLEHASAMLDARAFLSRRSSISLPCSIISLPSLEHASAALTFSHEPSTHYFTSLDLPPPWFLTF